MGGRGLGSGGLGSGGLNRAPQGMQAGQGEFHPLFLDPVLPTHSGHAQPSLHHQPLAGLYPVLQLLRQIAPTHHLELPRRIIGAQTLNLHQHFGYRGLVVLGVANLGSLEYSDFKQTVVHVGTPQSWPPS